ncbi:MAG: hypothetical protein Q9176_001331 [Flavoplaca citrina]
MGKKKHQKGETNTSEFPSSSNSIESGNVYTSPPFKFIVEGTAFYLHAALVSHYSKPLDRMMNGEVSEAQEGYATLEDVEEGTFGRFAEWLNKGYYTPGEVFTRPLDESRPKKSMVEDSELGKLEEPPPEAPQPADEPSIDLPAAVEDNWGSLGSKKSSKKSKRYATVDAWDVEDSSRYQLKDSSRSQLKESFIHRKATVRQESISIPQPLPNQSPEEDYTEVFLSHAQLYVFAEKYDMQTLKILALENLQTTLAIFTLHEQRTGDIITLLRYVYANTSETSDGVEDLRTLLRDYVGYEMDTLMKDDGFRDLMIADGGALLGDFLTMVMKRISD